MEEVETKQKRGKSFILIGKRNETESGGTYILIESNAKFNKLQKIMWKFLFNIDIEDIEEE